MINSKFNNLIVFITLIIISRSSIFSDKYFVIGLTFILLSIFISKKISFDNNFIYLLIVWYLINILAAVFNGAYKIPFVRISSNAIVFFLFPYLVLKLVGVNFWNLFERWIYRLTLISLPLFIINYFFQDIFNSFFSLFSPLTNGAFAYPYWSSLIYVNALVIDSILRNAGFMWEPGAFAMMIIWAMCYNWISTGANYNKRFYIYTIALISTFSTAGFLAFIFIIVGKYIKKITITNVLVLVVFGYLFFVTIYQMDFMAGKINHYIEGYQSNELNYSKHYKVIKVNRLSGAYYNLMKTIEYPFGYGVIVEKDFSRNIEIYGTNGLGGLLVMWGAILFLYILFLLSRFFNLINISQFDAKTILSFNIALLIMFFSNPISRNIFVYLIVLSPLLLKGKNTLGHNI
jgi:hypothetical protein